MFATVLYTGNHSERWASKKLSGPTPSHFFFQISYFCNVCSVFIPGLPFPGRPGFPDFFIPDFPGTKTARFPGNREHRTAVAGAAM